jgi:hypothetical protein
MSRRTQTPASTSHAKFGFSCDQSKLRTKILHPDSTAKHLSHNKPRKSNYTSDLIRPGRKGKPDVSCMPYLPTYVKFPSNANTNISGFNPCNSQCKTWMLGKPPPNHTHFADVEKKSTSTNIVYEVI